MRPRDAPSPFDETRLALIRETYAPRSYDKSGLLDPQYLLASENRFRVYYAALGAIPNADAELVLVGLTPGLTQVAEAARVFAEAPLSVRSDLRLYSERLRSRVSFAGVMRANLCLMLDALDLPAAMGINNSNELFHDVQSRAVATSALVFPVFVAPNLKNFSGSGIDLQTVHLFRMMIEELLVPRLEHASRALIVPLGVVAASGVRYAVTNGRVAPERVLVGMPHPSGSNGHRHRQFRENAEALRRRISSWFG